MRTPNRGDRAGKGRDSNSIPPLLEQGVSIILMDYVVEHQNRLLIERFGDLKGKLCYEGYYGRKKPCEVCALRQAIESGRSEVHEVKTKDGRIHEFRFIPFTDAGGVTKVVEVTTDIGERKRVEEELKSSEERLRILFEFAPDAYYLSDTNGTFIDGNKAAEELGGYKKEELIGKSFLKLKLLSPAQILKAAKLVAKNALGQPTGPDEFILNRKDGKQVTVEIRTYPMKIKDQKLVLGIARDITERKRADQALLESESKLQEQKLALEQKNIALGEIIAQIEVEKRKIKEDIETNIDIVVSPILEKLKIEKASAKYVNILKYHLGRLTSSFGSKITKKSLKLTPREIEICNMVKGGLTSKDISNLLNISYRTVEKHRRNIRHKIGISNKHINLTSFLREL